MSNDVVLAANDIITEIKETFDRLVMPAIMSDRVGGVSEKSETEIAKGKRIDMRIPRFLSISGKGGPGHESYVNVALFDHATSVAMAAMTFVVVDYLAADVDYKTARQCGAVSFAVGLMHDTDKLSAASSAKIDVDVIRLFFEKYKIDRFLGHFDVSVSVEQFAFLISLAEKRTSHTVLDVRVPDDYGNVVRKYVKFADRLDGLWLSDIPSKSVGLVMGEWNRTVSANAFFLSSFFSEYRQLVVSEPHHPFILRKFADNIEGLCRDKSGIPPLFHVVTDEVFVSVLPTKHFDEIIGEAARYTADGLPFESGIIITPAGLPKVTGAKPSWDALREAVMDGIPTGDMKLLDVKWTDFERFGEKILEIAISAGVPAGKIAEKGKRLSWAATQNTESLAFDDILTASLVSLAVGVEENTKDKQFQRKSREMALVKALDESSIPEWVNETDPLTRRTVLALLATAKFRKDPVLKESVLGRGKLFASWFEPGGVFADMSDPFSSIKESVANRLRALSTGDYLLAPSGEARCLITGEVTAGKSISATDELYGINSSAFSYREGRGEDRFSAKPSTHLSDMSYAEYRQRNAIFRKNKFRDDGIPLRISSLSSGGIFNLSVGEIDDREFGIFDMVRADTTAKNYGGMESYRGRTHLGRFDTMPNRFADESKAPGRISFLRIAMQSALRYGHPLHLFSGLPHPRKEFFHCDCMDPELRILLGGDGFRLEDMQKAIDLLFIVGGIAASTKAGGLNMHTIAKSFCIPSSRFGAACVAWMAARDHENAKDFADLARRIASHIDKEITEMDKNNKTDAIVTLGRLAVAIQRRTRAVDGANDEGFLFRTAVEGALEGYRSGQIDRESMIALVGGAISDDGERRQKTKGFYAAKENRPEGENIDACVTAFAEHFVDHVWNGIFRGIPPSSNIMRRQLGAYRYVFTRAKKPNLTETEPLADD